MIPLNVHRRSLRCILLLTLFFAPTLAFAQAGSLRFGLDPIDTLFGNDGSVVNSSPIYGITADQWGYSCSLFPNLLSSQDTGYLSCELSCVYDLSYGGFNSTFGLDYSYDLGGYGLVSCGGLCVYDHESGGFDGGGYLSYSARASDFIDFNGGMLEAIFGNCGVQTSVSIASSGQFGASASITFEGIPFLTR